MTLTSPRLFIAVPASQDDHLPPLNALLPTRSPPSYCSWDEVGLAGLLRPDGAGAEGLSPVWTRRSMRPPSRPYARGGPTLRRRKGARNSGLCGGLPRRREDPAIPDGPLTVGIDGDMCVIGMRRRALRGHRGQSILAFRRDDEEISRPQVFLALYRPWIRSRNGASSRSCSRKGIR